MDTDDPPRCQRCAGATTYVGRISLPAQIIYRCEACGHEMWMQSNPLRLRHPVDPPQAQQQQQPQPKPEPEE